MQNLGLNISDLNILDFNILELATINLIVALGSVLQASTGIGLSLVAVPFLVLIRPVLVPGPILFANLLLSAIVALGGRGAIDRAGLKPTLAGLLVGSGLGAIGLMWVPVAQLPLLFGSLILVAVGVSVVGIDLRLIPRNFVLAGMASGLMGTMVGIHGPPIALLYQRQAGNRVRATLGFVFAIAYALSLAALHGVGLFSIQEFQFGITLAPGVVLGYAVSRFATKWLDRGSWLRIAILTVSALGALTLLLRRR